MLRAADGLAGRSTQTEAKRPCHIGGRAVSHIKSGQSSDVLIPPRYSTTNSFTAPCAAYPSEIQA